IDTGLTNLGSLIGDHAKTAIGTLLGTGTVIGVGANVFGAVRPPKYVPPLAWGVGEATGETGTRLTRDGFLKIAERVLPRRDVAIKILSSAVGRTQDARARFLREARAAGGLQHRNIVTIYDLGEADGQLFIALELVDGRDLSQLIAGEEPLPLERRLDIAIDVLQGLAYAHGRGVIHRDIKPSNVRIASDGSVKIMDFGIARLQTADITGSGAIVGTPTYMAPEQITNGPITPATDLFAVGCLLYELLSYRKPFEGETVHGVLYQ